MWYPDFDRNQVKNKNRFFVCLCTFGSVGRNSVQHPVRRVSKATKQYVLRVWNKFVSFGHRVALHSMVSHMSCVFSVGAEKSVRKVRNRGVSVGRFCLRGLRLWWKGLGGRMVAIPGNACKVWPKGLTREKFPAHPARLNEVAYRICPISIKL